MNKTEHVFTDVWGVQWGIKEYDTTRNFWCTCETDEQTNEWVLHSNSFPTKESAIRAIRVRNGLIDE